MTLVPISRMVERVDRCRDDSDGVLYFELMLLGEMLAKLTIVGLVSGIAEESNRLRYSAESKLVRADGLGSWCDVLNEILTGPSSQFLHPKLYGVRKELTQSVDSSAWQHLAISELNACLLELDKSYPPLPNRVQGRNWFSLFTELRNKTKAHGAQVQGKLSALCPHLESALRAMMSGLELFRMEWAHLHRNLSGKYKVSPISELAPSFDELKRTKDKALANGVYLSLGEPAHVRLLEATTDLTDFFLPNGAFTDQKYELISYITGNTLNAESKEFLVPIGPLPKSETEGRGDLEVQGSTFTNLPPPLTEYVRRPELESELGNVLSKHDLYPVVTLYGGGGIGKTSLALSVLSKMTEGGPYDIIVWFSARDIDLLASGPKPVKPRVLDFKDIAKQYCDLVQPKGCHDKGFNAVEHFRHELQSSSVGRILFVFDNFETASNPIELFSAIETYARLPNKVLITTRHRAFKADYPIRVEGMKDGELDELIDATASRLNVSQLITPSYRSELKSESGGHPYVVKVLLGDVAKTRRLGKIERIVANSEDILVALFERTYNALSPAAQFCFLLLCGWRSTVPSIAVESVVLQSSEERFNVEDALEELERYSFLERSYPKDNEEFITIPLVAAKFGMQKLSISPYRNKIASMMGLLQQFGSLQISGIKHGVAPGIKRFLSFVAREAENNIETLKANVPIVESLARHYPEAWLMLSDIVLESGGDDALEKGRRYVSKFIESVDSQRRIEGWRRLVAISRRSGDVTAEAHALAQLCEFDEVPYNEISNAAHRLNSLSSAGLAGSEKFEILGQLRKIMEERLDEASATDISRLAWLCLHLKDDYAARSYTRMGLQSDPSNLYCQRLYDRLFG